MYNQSIPYTIMLDIVGTWSEFYGNTYVFPDVYLVFVSFFMGFHLKNIRFDPEFEDMATSIVLSTVVPRVNDPYLLVLIHVICFCDL
jgi:hypothetical protein